MEIFLVDTVDEVLAEALEPEDSLAARRDGGKARREQDRLAARSP
jgi:hypothetical protein